MKRFFNIFAIALASVLMFSCQEDADVDNFGFGGTVKGKFSLVVPSNEMVEITRATEEQESDVTSVHLFFFDHNSKEALGNESVTLGTATQSGNYTRTYNITTTTSFDNGVVDIYAIANTESSLGNVADFTAVANNHTEFTKLLMSLELLNTPFSTMTMSGKLEGVVASQQFGLTGNIQVKRPYAKVNFTIKNGNSNFTFTPTQYNVKNVPTSGAVFEGGVASEVKFKNYDGMTDFVENQGAQVIEFYMLENKAGKAEGVANYNDRELRKDVNGGKHEEFAHGLANATYVEILGEGKGTNAAGEPISATVKYTIHLGDFAADATDFNVNRNTFYNYTVTVNGVDKIVVEADQKKEMWDDDEFQHGAEGTVINLQGSKMVYTLDAHYEQVLLNLNLTKLPTDDDDVVLVVSTPYMDEANKGAMITWSMIESEDFGSKFDTEWVEFYPSNALRAYPSGDDKLMKTVDFLKYVKGLATDSDTSNDKLSVVAYINEYFYDKNPLTGEGTTWPEFVNKEDRVMRILQEPQISKDGHSISTKALCSFTQRSIRTFFNENTAGAYGMESFEETGAMSEFSPYSMRNSSYNDDNGYANFTASGWFRSGSTWSTYVNVAAHGYGSNGQPNGNVYENALQSGYTNNAAYACLLRNRSLEDRKWYPAAPNQYVAFWYGEASVPNDVKLYKGNPAENFTGDYSTVSHYWTSGTSSNRVFWAIEGATLSQSASWAGSGSRHIRCLRNFESTVAKTAEATTLDGSTAIVLKNFNDNAYRGIATQRLPVHHEREAANKLPKAFVVAKYNLTATWTAMTDAPTAPQILSAEVMDGKLVVKFLEKDNYSVATSATGSKTDIILGVENSYEISNPNTSTTYHFFTKRNYNTYSQYITVGYSNGTWSANNTAQGTGGSYSISAGTSDNHIPLMAAIHQDLCSQYTEESAKGTAWRVPTQRELLAMYILEINGINANTHSSTLFSARNVASTNNSNDLRYGYVWYNNGNTAFGMQSYSWGTGTRNGYVRCVRDASEAELQSLGISNSGDQEDGGNPMNP